MKQKQLFFLTILILGATNLHAQCLKVQKDCPERLFSVGVDSILSRNTILRETRGKRFIALGEAAHVSKTFYSMQRLLSGLFIDSLNAATVFLENSYFRVNALQTDTFGHKQNDTYDELLHSVGRRGAKIIGLNPGFIWYDATKFVISLDSFSPRLADRFRNIFRLDSTMEGYYWYQINKPELDSLILRLLGISDEVNAIANYPYPKACYFLIKDLQFLFMRRTRGDAIRDSFMFQIIKDNSSPNGANVNIAHNAHLKRNYRRKPNLGDYLSTAFGAEYYGIGTDFHTGTYKTNKKNRQSGNYEFTMVQAQQIRRSVWLRHPAETSFFLEASSMPDKFYKTTWVGGLELVLKVNYQRGFDGWIFFTSIEAAR